MDVLGALLSLLATYYFVSQHAKAWFFSFGAIAINSWLYWRAGIYADVALELFYFITTIYGWYRWRALSYPKPFAITCLPTYITTLILPVAMLLLFSLIYYLLIKVQSTIAGLDALTTTLSLVAQWLMCQQLIVTWICWGIVDVLYALVYWQKQLPFHVLLMLVYLVMAVWGYVSWARKNSARCFIKLSFKQLALPPNQKTMPIESYNHQANQKHPIPPL